MDNAKPSGMGSLKEYIEDLEKRFGGIRPAGKVLKIDHQRLLTYKNSGQKLQAFLQFLDRARKASKLSKSAFWDTVVKDEDEDKEEK